LTAQFREREFVMLSRSDLVDAAKDLNQVLQLSPPIDLRLSVGEITELITQAGDLVREGDTLEINTRHVLTALTSGEQVAEQADPATAAQTAPVMADAGAGNGQTPISAPAASAAVAAPSTAAPPTTAPPAATVSSTAQTTQPTSGQASQPSRRGRPPGSGNTTPAAPRQPAAAKDGTVKLGGPRYPGSLAQRMDQALERGGTWQGLADELQIKAGVLRAHAKYRVGRGHHTMVDDGATVKLTRGADVVDG
jgi:hypothetical protein